MSDISFPSFPSNWRLPLFWADLDPSQAGAAQSNQPALLIGQTIGTIPTYLNYPVAVGSVQRAAGWFGAGSMLERMVARFFAINPVGVLYVYPLADPVGGVTATGSISITADPTDVGTFSLYIAGNRVQVAVTGIDTPATTAVALAAAINALAVSPITAAVDGTITSKVNLTCRWKGATGNDVTLIPNYGGALAGEIMPPGMAVTIVPMASGSGAPDMSACIAALGDDEYDYCAMPYSDSTSLTAWDLEYGFNLNGRWGYLRELYGTVFSARRDTYSNLMAWGPTGNSGVISVMGVEPTSPSPIWEWTAAYAAQGAAALLADPGRPLQSLELTGILPAPRSDRWSKGEANALAGVGVAAQRVGSNGFPIILVECSRWQVNAYGAPDQAYMLITTLHTLAYLLRRFKSAITSKYPRHKLANDGTKFANGQAIVTPKVLKAEIISEYRQAEFIGLVENTALFIANLIVERDSTNSNRVNVLWPPDLINQLRIFAVLSQFRLQYPDPSLVTAA